LRIGPPAGTEKGPISAAAQSIIFGPRLRISNRALGPPYVRFPTAKVAVSAVIPYPA